MLTKQDKNYLNKTFATKKELKKELERFATKKDLEKFATKKELKKALEKFATKDQLTQQALDIGTEFERVREEFAARAKQVDKRFDMMDNRFDKMENLMKSLIEKVLVEVRGTSERVDKIELHLGLVVA